LGLEPGFVRLSINVWDGNGLININIVWVNLIRMNKGHTAQQIRINKGHTAQQIVLMCLSGSLLRETPNN